MYVCMRASDLGREMDTVERGGHPGWTEIKLPTDGLRFLMDRYSEQIVLTQARINGGTLISTVIANLHGYEVCPRRVA